MLWGFSFGLKTSLWTTVLGFPDVACPWNLVQPCLPHPPKTFSSGWGTHHTKDTICDASTFTHTFTPNTMYSKREYSNKPDRCKTAIAPHPGDFFESFLLAGFVFCIQKSSRVLQLYCFLKKEVDNVILKPNNTCKQATLLHYKERKSCVWHGGLI